MSEPTSLPTLPTSSVRRLINRHPVAAFLVLVYGVSWILYIPTFLSESGVGVLPFELSPLPFNLLAVIFGFTHSAYVVTSITQGREGGGQLRSRYAHWRVGIGWYLFALFALPIAVVTGAAVWHGSEPLRTFAEQWDLLFTVFLPNALVIAVLFSMWEEGGWTGSLLPRLQETWFRSHHALRSS